VKIEKDGNCGPRVISLKKYGSQSKHGLVRKETCERMKTGIKSLYKNELESETYKKKLELIQNMEKDGVWFSDLEL